MRKYHNMIRSEQKCLAHMPIVKEKNKLIFKTFVWNVLCKIEVKGLLCVARLKGGNNEEDCLLKYNTFFE